MSDGDFNCPECGNMNSKVFESRPLNGKRYRRRKCSSGHVFITTEAVTAEAWPESLKASALARLNNSKRNRT